MANVDIAKANDRIITALDYCARDKVKSVKERIIKLSESNKLLQTPYVNAPARGPAVIAEVNCGQWIAKCECGGAEAVYVDEPIFYCLSCGNYTNEGYARPVKFPKEVKEIENTLMKRKTKIKSGMDEIAKITQAQPESYPRAWEPDETLQDLEDQNEEIGV